MKGNNIELQYNSMSVINGVVPRPLVFTAQILLLFVDHRQKACRRPPLKYTVPDKINIENTCARTTHQ